MATFLLRLGKWVRKGAAPVVETTALMTSPTLQTTPTLQTRG